MGTFDSPNSGNNVCSIHDDDMSATPPPSSRLGQNPSFHQNLIGQRNLIDAILMNQAAPHTYD